MANVCDGCSDNKPVSVDCLVMDLPASSHCLLAVTYFLDHGERERHGKLVPFTELLDKARQCWFV